MLKVLKTVVIAMIATLLLQMPCYASSTVSTKNDDIKEEVINVETLEKEQLLTLEKGKMYIISCPVSRSDWKISEIRVQVKNVGWITIEEGEESSYLQVEECETVQGRVALKVTCKTEYITAIIVRVQNKQTEETEEYTLKVKVQKSEEDENRWVVIPVEPDTPDEEKEVIVIDTSSWVIDRNWMETDLVNGTLRLKMPSWVDSTGAVKCTYEINGVEVGDNYTITDTGIYSVVVKFSLAEGMEENYNLSSSATKVTYQVNPDQLSGSKPKFNILMNELQADNEGEKKIAVWLDKEDDTFAVNNVQWYLRYDPDVLEIKSYAKGPTSSSALQMDYDGSDSSGIGYSMIYTGGYYADNVTLETIVFNVKDPDAEDIAVNITEVQASDMWTLYSTEYTNGYGIVLNQVSNIIGVTLPNPQPVTKTSIEPEQEKVLSDDIQTDDNLNEEASEEFDDELTEEIEVDPVEEQDDEQAEASVEVTEDDE